MADYLLRKTYGSSDASGSYDVIDRETGGKAGRVFRVTKYGSPYWYFYRSGERIGPHLRRSDAADALYDGWKARIRHYGSSTGPPPGGGDWMSGCTPA